MSFGFGFALPAYPLRGGAGNNPFNQDGPTLDLSFVGTAGNLSGADTYTLNTDFITPQYQIAAQYVVWETGVGLVDKTFSQIITFTRASTGTYFDSAGVLQSAAIDAPRFDYNPATLAAQGLLIEEARTNSIRNNTMQGAVAGTPGTLPTNWNVGSSGLTQTIVGTGTSAGVTYIDIRVNGTTTGAGGVQIKPDGNAGVIAATAAQAWAMSSWVAIVGGSTANTTGQRFVINEYSAGPTYLRTAVAATNILAGGATLTRVSGAITTGASTTILEPIIILDAASGVAIDITLRIGLPQLEQGAFATSVIPTTTTALTRSADVASVNTLAPWYNATEGTLFVQAQDMSDAAHATSQPRAASLNDGTTSNTVDISRIPASAQGRARIEVGGANQFNSLTTAWPLATQAKVALAYKANNYAACLGGGAVVTNTASSLIPTVTALSIGDIRTTVSNHWVGWIQRVAYYPRRLSNAELQAITA